MKNTKKCGILSAVLVIALCLSLIAGSTFALFTSQRDVNIAVTAGNVDVEALLVESSLKTWSLYETEDDARTDGSFVNGGTAAIQDGYNVVLNRMTPGDVAKFTIDVTNNSDVHVMYRVRMTANGQEDAVNLIDALQVTALIDGREYAVTGADNATLWQAVEAGAEIGDIEVTVNFPDAEDNNNYQGANTTITFVVEAVQGNAKVYDKAVADVEDMYTDNGFVADGILNANGETIEVTDGVLALAQNQNVKLIDMTLDGSNMTVGGGVVTFYYNDSTLTLGADAKIIAPTTPILQGDQRGIVAGVGGNTTLTLEKGSCVEASGANADALYYQSGTHALYLNDAGLITVTNGATGIRVVSGATLNIYVPSADVKAAYVDMINVETATGCVVNWYVNGVLVTE